MNAPLGKKILLALALSAGMFFLPSASADDRTDAYGILDGWTSVRWGEDNIAWVVHYPEELVDPWVRSEAERQKLRPEQAEELRRSFAGELRIGSATAVLLSIYSYGASPVNIAPLADNIALINSSGDRVPPMVFEKKLDSPISGLVQGFVFFPLQRDKNFRLAVKGLLPSGETNFSFASAPAPAPIIATAPAEPKPRQQKPAEKEVVVKIPTKQPAAPPVKPEEPVFEDPGETFQPTVPPPPPPVPEIPSVDVTPAAAPEPEEPKLGPRQVFEIYLKAWIDGDADKMYSLLSTESKGRISKENFAKEVMSGGFRNALRSGHKVTWTGDAAKVTVARKLLFVRTLESRQVKFTEEDGSARVSW
ncbi:MAG: hypothetical protein LBR87_00290 [Synergistaceae bacterium]|jgi:hypothetical protein|nr:hypothetical protein [Synergistaceae bacterium]